METLFPGLKERKKYCVSERDMAMDKIQVLPFTGHFAASQPWLGLRLDNNGKWAFDHGNGTVPVNNASTFWKNGQVPTDQSKPCAYIDVDGSWSVVSN